MNKLCFHNNKNHNFSLTEGVALVRGCSKAKFRNEVRTIGVETCFQAKETVK